MAGVVLQSLSVQQTRKSKTVLNGDKKDALDDAKHSLTKKQKIGNNSKTGNEDISPDLLA